MRQSSDRIMLSLDGNKGYKMVDKIPFRTKMFFRYFFSFVGITLFAMSCIVIIAVQNVVDKKHEQEIQLLNNKLGIVAKEIDEQITDMRRIVIKIVYSDEFKQYYLYDDSYYKIGLLECMDEYKDSVNIMEDYFLIYPGKEELLSCNHGTLSRDICIKGAVYSENYGKIMELFEAEYNGSNAKLIIEKEENYLFLIYPLASYKGARSALQGEVGFLLSENSIDRRITRLIGEVDGGITIYYDEFCIYGMESDKEGTLIAAESANRKVQVCARLGNAGYFQKILSAKSIAFFLGSIFCVILLSVCLAYKSMLPIYRLTKIAGIDVKESFVFDWQDIEMELAKILQNREIYNKEIYESLRQQIIFLIVTGRYSAQFSNVLLFFNIRADAPLYGVIACIFPQTKLGMEYDTNMLAQIEALTGDAVSVYACWESDRVLKILVAAEESAQFDEMLELLDNFLGAVWSEVTIELFEQGNSIESLKGIHMTEPVKEMKFEDKSDECKMSKLVDHAIQYMKEHCIDHDISLERVAEELCITPTYLSRILKKETGITYREYITNMKMEKAKELLLEGNANVMQVSETIGYVNVSYFIKLFKNYTGLTPARYREENYTSDSRF